MSNHIVITGTGRSGTTFIMQVLTAMGIDTGFKSPFDSVREECNAGMDRDHAESYWNTYPYVIKSPWFCWCIENMIKSGIAIDHIILPMRKLSCSSLSRKRIYDINGQNLKTPGTLWGTDDPNKQEGYLKGAIYQLIYSAAVYDIPVLLMRFPKFATDGEYMFKKLSVVFALEKNKFNSVFSSLSKPELIHFKD